MSQQNLKKKHIKKVKDCKIIETVAQKLLELHLQPTHICMRNTIKLHPRVDNLCKIYGQTKNLCKSTLST